MIVPATANPDVQQAFRDIHTALDKLTIVDINLSGRRVVNAGRSVSPKDYITRMEVDEGLARVEEAIVKSEISVGGALREQGPVMIAAFASRPNAVYFPNTIFVASDRNFVSWVSDGSVWKYLAGMQVGLYGSITGSLTTDDAGYLYYASDTLLTWKWSGSAWARLNPDAGSAQVGLVSTGTQTIAGAKTFSSDVTVPDEAYAAGWDGSLEVPTKNAVYDKIEGLNLAASVYTPTLTNALNLDGSTAYQCQYMRVGSVVTVSGKLGINPTATGAINLRITLPVASNFGVNEDCGGVGSSMLGEVGAIYGDTVNNEAYLVLMATDVTDHPLSFIFSYRII